jgi:hypothetical protein
MSRIREKLLLVDTEDKGRDLKDVQELLKRLESVQEYMAGLDKRIAEHQTLAKVIHWAWALIASISGGTGENLPTN